MGAQEDASIPGSYTYLRPFQLMIQHDLDMLGVGAAGQVYDVGDQIVLKTCRTYAPPCNDASQSDLYDYASDTVFGFGLLKDERTVLRLLQDRPHPHIIQSIDINQPEGLYLLKYQQVPMDMKSSPSGRIRLYRDIADALRHLHSLGIIHADLRIDNVLCDNQLHGILCDFSAASPCGYPSLIFSHLPLPINGPSPILSEASDMFALASLMFGLEHGFKPELSFENEKLTLPELKSGNPCIDEIIQKAWLGNYKHTSDMLNDLSSIDIDHHTQTPEPVPDFESLKSQVVAWRNHRKQKFGMAVSNHCHNNHPLQIKFAKSFSGCVIDGILSEEQLKTLAAQHDIDPKINLRFSYDI